MLEDQEKIMVNELMSIQVLPFATFLLEDSLEALYVMRVFLSQGKLSFNPYYERPSASFW